MLSVGYKFLRGIRRPKTWHLTLIVTLGLIFLGMKPAGAATNFWAIQSIDTMKYSRDTARMKLNSPSFDKEINSQVSSVGSAGANFIAIDTPYDAEFLPFLKRWVTAARRAGLKVWFRGNWSGWEGWFGYGRIGRDEHIQKTTDFILNNSTLFQGDDIFDACPECENGGVWDVNTAEGVKGYRRFLIDEHKSESEAFRAISKDININIHSMNGSVARLVMDKETTAATGGVVVIDDYVKDPREVDNDIKQIALQSGGKVLLGEFGVPIPDINGAMTESQQADWIENALYELKGNLDFIGINYWVGHGGSTAIWNEDGTPKKAVAVIKSFFVPSQLSIKVINSFGFPIDGAKIRIEDGERLLTTANGGIVKLPYQKLPFTLFILAENYNGRKVVVDSTSPQTIVLRPQAGDVVIMAVESGYGVLSFLENLLRSIFRISGQHLAETKT